MCKMAGSYFSIARWGVVAVVCLASVAVSSPAILNNDVYPSPDSLPSELYPPIQPWPLALRKEIGQTTDLREFIMKYVEDVRICTSRTFYDIVTKKSRDKSGELWWNKRCGTRRGATPVSPYPEIKPSDMKKIEKLMKNKKVKCNPKKAVVELPNDDPLEILKPSCVYVSRCGGCCDSPLLECLPVANRTKTRTFKVMALTKNNMNNKMALKKIKVEEHKACLCQCKERAEHCTQKQIYDKNSCRCMCPQQKICPNGKVWDEKQCDCVCNNVSECTTGRVFDNETCRCRGGESNAVLVT